MGSYLTQVCAGVVLNWFTNQRFVPQFVLASIASAEPLEVTWFRPIWLARSPLSTPIPAVVLELYWPKSTTLALPVAMPEHAPPTPPVGAHPIYSPSCELNLPVESTIRFPFEPVIPPPYIPS